MSFTQFYQQGGLFMHPITIVAIVSGVSLVRRVWATRSTMTKPAVGTVLDGGSTPSLVAAGLMIGTMGTVFGSIELCRALQTIPSDAWSQAAARGAAISVSPLAYALLVLTPVVLMHAVLRPLERRVSNRCSQVPTQV